MFTTSVRMAEQLAELGFCRVPGAGAWRHNGVSFATEGAWAVLRATAPATGDPLADLWGQPGPWKAVSGSHLHLAHSRHVRSEDVTPRRFRRVFEVPLSLLVEGEGDDGGDALDAGRGVSPLGALVAWGLATLEGRCPPGWQTPSREEVEARLAPGALTVQCGAHARQGQVVADGGRLALRMPILARRPAGLSECRLSWLRQVLLDAQDRWRLVRVGPVPDGPESPVEAEVDLTGAPPLLLDGLAAVAATALRCAVSWVVGPCAFLAHAAREPRALAMCRGSRAPGASSAAGG